MPAGVVDQHHGVAAFGHLAGDLLQQQVHAGGRDLRQHQRHSGITLRADGAKDVSGAIAQVLNHARPLAAQKPAPCHPAFLANARFIEEPDLQPLRRRLRGGDPVEHLPELFLNAACPAASLSGCCGRGVCHDRSSACSNFARPLSE